ncbi:MAG: YHYH protein [Pseudomonadota bacterium]
MNINIRYSLSATALLGMAALILETSAASLAASNSVKLTETGNQRCMVSNGIPDHGTGNFPNPGNPNSIANQNIRLCVPLNPVKGTSAKPLRGTVGFALNGIILRPGTADFYDADSPRGFSRDRSSGWNLEGLGAREQLGMDANNAHVDRSGIYHYHGPSKAIMKSAKGSLIGYAADGHEIHYVGSKMKSSYQLKSGTRPSAPGGTYDGTYNEDWVYKAGSGQLDQCNGGMLDGRYVYFATDYYPFFPRCVYGNIGSGFRGGETAGSARPNRKNRNQSAGLPGQGRPGARPPQGQRPQAGDRRRKGPPQFAVAACTSKAVGNACSFSPPRGGQVSGMCRSTPANIVACVPNGRRPRG